MRYPLLVELIEPAHWVAYVRDHPGCFGSGPDEASAVAGAREQIPRYLAWLARHGAGARDPDRVETEVAERYVPPPEQLRETSLGEVYIVNALFADDERPLTADEITAAADILEWQRQDLLALLPIALPAEAEPVLRHIGGAEWWYWDRLDRAMPFDEVPEDGRQRLKVTRRWTLTQLPGLAGLEEVYVKSGERWTARKLVRRTAWHERDHMNHIADLLP